MKISERWLREWVDPPLSADQLGEQLTMAGLEVESISSLRPAWGRVIAGLVESVLPHPDVRDLKICRVDAGSDARIQVVCGAKDVSAGRLYALALPGARLADGSILEATAIRNMRSEGMLCSRAELDLGDESDRLLELGTGIAPGTSLIEALELDDCVFEIALTPNRGDCLSINGLAREVGVLNDVAVRRPGIAPVEASAETCRLIHLHAPDACPRYLGRVIEDIDIGRPTPIWIIERLRRSDVRGINIVVDISNYVMLELGQPMHVFDNERLQGDISVRWARQDECLKLLDGQQLKLAEDTLVIADASGAVALAGIMGGFETAVSATSRHVFLESAFFAPEYILGRARRYDLQTDASQRFERGVDFSLPAQGLERATELLLRYCGGRAGPVTQAVSNEHLPNPGPVLLRSERMQGLLGVRIEPDTVTRILGRLGFAVQQVPAGLEVTVPTHRFDVALEADLIEEVARIHGYGHIPSRQPGGRLSMHRGRPDPRPSAWRRILADRGYFEAITYSFVDEVLQRRLLGDQEPVRLRNPISAELGVMRVSLLPGLLQAVLYNLNRQQPRVRLFEIGRVFGSGGDLRQDLHVAGMTYGNIYDEQWDRNNRLSDLFDIKGDVGAILAAVDRNALMDCEPAAHPACQPGQTSDIIFNKQRVGIIGALHPAILAELGIDNPLFAFELNAARIAATGGAVFANFSRFPSMRRDIALVVERDVPVGDLLAEVRSSAGELLNNLELFDVYEGEGIDLGKKSLALGLTFQKSSSTLIDVEVEAALARILGAAQRKFGAKLRH